MVSERFRNAAQTLQKPGVEPSNGSRSGHEGVFQQAELFSEVYIQRRAYRQPYRSVNCTRTAVLLIGLDIASLGATYIFTITNKQGASILFHRQLQLCCQLLEAVG